MYSLSKPIKIGAFISILKDDEEIEALSGLYMNDEQDVQDVKEIVRLANIGLSQEKDK